MSEWISFSQRLPKPLDANKAGEIWLLETNNNVRRGLWDWIQPVRTDAAEMWQINGFKAWKRIE